MSLVSFFFLLLSHYMVLQVGQRTCLQVVPGQLRVVDQSHTIAMTTRVPHYSESLIVFM